MVSPYYHTTDPAHRKMTFDLPRDAEILSVTCDNNPLQYSLIRKGDTLLCNVELNKPKKEGDPVFVNVTGMLPAQVKKESDGSYSCSWTYTSNESVVVRKTINHVLPKGAEIISMSDNASIRPEGDLQRVRVDEFVPPGGTVSFYYRYSFLTDGPASRPTTPRAATTLEKPVPNR